MGVYAYFQKLRLSTFKEWNTKIFELQHISRKYWRQTISGGWVLSSNLVARSTQSCRKTETSGWQLASRCLSAPMSIFILTSRIFNSQEFPKLSLHKSVLFILLNCPVFFSLSLLYVNVCETYVHNMARLRALTALFRLTCLHSFDVSRSKFEIKSF